MNDSLPAYRPDEGLQRVSLHDSPQAVGLDKRKLKQGFRQRLGRTVHDHLERTRVSAAQSLLAEGGLGVTKTALAAGYSNPSHFAKFFKRSVGISPSRWRHSPS